MINENKITNRLLQLMEEGFFGKSVLNENINSGIDTKLFQAAYNYVFGGNLKVDGVPGEQTNAALEQVNKRYPNEGVKGLFDEMSKKLKGFTGLNVGQGGSNNPKVVGAVQVLLNLAGQKNIIPDGVVGNMTIGAINKVLGGNNVTSANINQLIGISKGETVSSKSKDVPSDVKKTAKKYGVTVGTWSMSGSLVALNMYFNDASGKKRNLGDYSLEKRVKDKYFDYPGGKSGTWTLENDKFTFFKEDGKTKVYSEADVDIKAPNKDFLFALDQIIKKIYPVLTSTNWGYFIVRGEQLYFYNSNDKFIGSAAPVSYHFKDKAKKNNFRGEGSFFYKKSEKTLYLHNKNTPADKTTSYTYKHK